MGNDPEIMEAIRKNAEMVAALPSDQELDEDKELPYYCTSCRKKRTITKSMPATSSSTRDATQTKALTPNE